jgi:hypothetical protein
MALVKGKPQTEKTYQAPSPNLIPDASGQAKQNYASMRAVHNRKTGELEKQLAAEREKRKLLVKALERVRLVLWNDAAYPYDGQVIRDIDAALAQVKALEPPPPPRPPPRPSPPGEKPPRPCVLTSPRRIKPEIREVK